MENPESTEDVREVADPGEQPFFWKRVQQRQVHPQGQQPYPSGQEGPASEV